MRSIRAPLAIAMLVLVACSSDHTTAPTTTSGLVNIGGIWSTTGPDQVSYQFELTRQIDRSVTGSWKGAKLNCLVDCEIVGDVKPGMFNTEVTFLFVATNAKLTGSFSSATVDEHTLTGTLSLWDHLYPDFLVDPPTYSGSVTLMR